MLRQRVELTHMHVHDVGQPLVAWQPAAAAFRHQLPATTPTASIQPFLVFTESPLPSASQQWPQSAAPATHQTLRSPTHTAATPQSHTTHTQPSSQPPSHTHLWPSAACPAPAPPPSPACCAPPAQQHPPGTRRPPPPPECARLAGGRGRGTAGRGSPPVVRGWWRCGERVMEV
jgi:hypothetical protein